jgi:hypothetical protein
MDIFSPYPKPNELCSYYNGSALVMTNSTYTALSQFHPPSILTFDFLKFRLVSFHLFQVAAFQEALPPKFNIVPCFLTA